MKRALLIYTWLTIISGILWIVKFKNAEFCCSWIVCSLPFIVANVMIAVIFIVACVYSVKEIIERKENKND